jgi:hypothetical protein
MDLKMIKAATIFTYELEDPQLAMADLKKQLQKQIVLLKSTVGIMMCDPEFVRTGVVKTVCEKFPFPIAGATSVAQSADGETGRLMLTLMVLTSDDVSFAAGVSKAANEEELYAEAASSYQKAARRLGTQPKMIMIFPPLATTQMPGNLYVDAYARLCPNLPIFGSMAIDDIPKFSEELSIGGGRGSKEQVSFILVGGNVAPRFFLTLPKEEMMLPCSGTITKSQGNVLMEINGAPAYEHFERVGFAKDGTFVPGLRFLPLLMDHEKRKACGKTPISNEVIYFDYNGFAVCRLDLSQNSTFRLGIFKSKDILEASRELIEIINAERGAQALIMFSCLARRLSMLMEPLKELNLLAETVHEDTPYMIAYSGGEFCPSPGAEGAIVSRFYNYALIACLL